MWRLPKPSSLNLSSAGTAVTSANMQKIVVAKALVFNGQSEVLLVRRSETAPRRPLEWDFPGGFVDDDDESYQLACLREIREETGLEVKNGVIHLGYTESGCVDLGGGASDVSWLYFTTVADGTDVQLSYEHNDFCWVTLQEATKLIKYDTQLRALDYVLLTQNKIARAE